MNGPVHQSLSCNTYEARRVVVADRLCITKSLQDWIGLQNLLLQPIIGLAYRSLTSNGREVLDDLFGVFRLASTGFTTELQY